MPSLSPFDIEHKENARTISIAILALQPATQYTLRFILLHFTAVLNYLIYYYFNIYLILYMFKKIVRNIFELIKVLHCISLFTKVKIHGVKQFNTVENTSFHVYPPKL